MFCRYTKWYIFLIIYLYFFFRWCTCFHREAKAHEQLIFSLCGKGPFMHYFMFLTSLGPLSPLMIYSTVNHQKLPFSDPTNPPLWWRNTWMVPKLTISLKIAWLLTGPGTKSKNKIVSWETCFVSLIYAVSLCLTNKHCIPIQTNDKPKYFYPNID